MKPVAAIVPAYNEEETIGPVVKALVGSGFFNEVIVISDGSTDKTAAYAREAGATLVHELPRRGGKAAAMQHGITHTDAPIIFFADADLYGFNKDHIKKILDPVVQGKKVMNVGIRDRGAFFMGLSKHLPLIGGERAIIRKVIEDIPQKYLQGFMVEAAMNYYCRSRKLPYGSVPCNGLHIRHKYQKVGVGKAMGQYFRMSWQVLHAMIAVRWAHLLGKF